MRHAAYKGRALSRPASGDSVLAVLCGIAIGIVLTLNF